MSSLIEQIEEDRAKGTQGDWKKDKYGNLTAPPHSSSNIITVAGLNIAHMSVIDDAWCDEFKTNTRRIARVPEMELALIAAHEKVERLERQNAELRAQDANGWRTDMENAPHEIVDLMVDGSRVADCWCGQYSWESTSYDEGGHTFTEYHSAPTHWRYITLPEEGE